ncbi:uncharacterized protein BO97DRAFT_382496 [Aspergillus homomorphus CBS 101889]|uniref:Fungal N-terminal domain-containing protein n=1 Tax=Aspergillus homomorphus (strain CBS 101889) TaxID=1450537 RepID=A0A395I8E5_ASPHC|nr:hypothetical protein BO97DRAFT_382496 [Aspergillus homomorphus CBS 101889]RAL16225.1 hypothetical protein BO97DRAFT_382496 [Aspergillus homomorphus CBS 101889]
MSFPQIGLGDVMTTLTTAWTIYKNVKEGPGSAAADFNSFRQEFGAIKDLLEQIQQTKRSTIKGERDLGLFYNQTIDECAEFVHKHRQLAQNETTSGGRCNSFGTKASTLFEKATWPLERDEAERLRRKLERCLKIATLKSSQETRDATLGFMKATEHNQLENIEMLRSIKTMTSQISLLLRRCMLENPVETDPFDAHHPSHRASRLKRALLESEHVLSAIPENDDILSQVDSQRYQKVLDRIREISERLSNLTRRLDTYEAHELAVGHSPGGLTYAVDDDSSQKPNVAAMVRFLHQVSDDVRDALGMVGYGHDLVPNRELAPKNEASVKAHHSINETAEEWEQFRQWLDFQLVHAFKTDAYDLKPIHSPGLPLQRTSPSISPSPDVRTPVMPISRQRSVESDSTIGSPQSVISLPIPDRKLALTSHPVHLEFPDPNVSSRVLFRPLLCNVVACFNMQTNEPEAIEAIDIQGGVKVTQTIIRGSSTVKSSMLPYVPSQRVPAAQHGLWFQGSHKTKIEDHQTVARYHISPIYRCHDSSDFECFQEILLRRKVVLSVDVRKISVNATDCHANSAETIRILEDPITQGLSLLYFASFPGTSRRARFTDVPMSDLGAPHAKSKHIKFAFQGASRRSSMDSGTSVLSQESRHSTFTTRGSDQRTKYLELEFYEDKDCTSFLRVLKNAEGD